MDFQPGVVYIVSSAGNGGKGLVVADSISVESVDTKCVGQECYRTSKQIRDEDVARLVAVVVHWRGDCYVRQSTRSVSWMISMYSNFSWILASRGKILR
jgi:hypothetical protein